MSLRSSTIYAVGAVAGASMLALSWGPASAMTLSGPSLEQPVTSSHIDKAYYRYGWRGGYGYRGYGWRGYGWRGYGYGYGYPGYGYGYGYPGYGGYYGGRCWRGYYGRLRCW
jgi:hypothetical protein